jgi:hypothetical protein
MQQLDEYRQTPQSTPAQSVSSRPVIGEPMRCGHCGDVIGVYEPLVLLDGGEPRTTSAAAEPQIGDEPGVLFHRACYAESHHVAGARRSA